MEKKTIEDLEEFTTVVANQDFMAAFKYVQDHGEELAAQLQGAGIRDALRKATKDRLQIAFVDSVAFDKRSLKEAMGRLERLLSFRPGTFVLSQAWGLGEIRRLDDFYRRITVDFTSRKGHQLTFEAACETLVLAPENHILVTKKADPARIEQLLKETPGDFVVEMLKSFGDMPITKLEELCAVHGFVKSANWKAFWERARAALRQNKCVEIPTRRAEPIHLKASAETYGDTWFTAFEGLKDPKSILSSVRELQGTARAKQLSAEDFAKIAKRLAFALKGTRGVDDALYARIAFCLSELKLDEALVAKARAYLWADKRYLEAARALPARETGALVQFLTAEDRETTKKDLFAVLPEMCFAFLSETLTFFAKDADCEEAVSALLKDPHAPATLITFILGRYDTFKHWSKLPALITILTHAIALGEGRQSGETLRMQNIVRRLFADQKWLEDVFSKLESADQVLLFERFQASIAWDPSTHHLIVMRMTRIVPELSAHLVRRVEPKKIDRITSMRSYAERKAAYLKLINEEMPANVKRIEFAKSYGDLSENAEYQYAKDEQRALMQKQTILQDELNAVKAVDFSDVVADEVRPGTMVTIRSAAGEERVYTVLGEWDNDLERNVISNKAKLAQNLLGKKPGDTFDLPDAEGGVSQATVVAISELSVEMREWVKVPAGYSL